MGKWNKMGEMENERKERVLLQGNYLQNKAREEKVSWNDSILTLSHSSIQLYIVTNNPHELHSVSNLLPPPLTNSTSSILAN